MSIFAKWSIKSRVIKYWKFISKVIALGLITPKFQHNSKRDKKVWAKMLITHYFRTELFLIILIQKLMEMSIQMVIHWKLVAIWSRSVINIKIFSWKMMKFDAITKEQASKDHPHHFYQQAHTVRQNSTRKIRRTVWR